MKKAQRELIRQERRKPARIKRNKNSLGPFAIWSRTIFVIAPIMVIALLAASFLTPLFAVEKVLVTGVDRLDEKKLVLALEPLKEKPLTLITDVEIAGLLSGFELIETFTFQAEPPSTLKVKIRERQPLLVMTRSGQNFLYDAAGVQIDRAERLGVYPFLIFEGNPQNDPRFAHAVDLLLSLPVELYLNVFSVEVSSQLTSVIRLRRSNISVIWGDNQQSLLKSEVLNSLIATGQKDGVRVDVSSPNAPVVSHD